jgi:hypothetical protein
LPIPVLDGGHLLFYAIEGVRRRPLSQRMQEIGFQIGIALVLMLMVYVNLNDLLRVWRRLTELDKCRSVRILLPAPLSEPVKADVERVPKKNHGHKGFKRALDHVGGGPKPTGAATVGSSA